MSCRTTFPNMNIPKNTWPNIRGSSSVVTYPAIDENERAQTRFLLRRAWQTELKIQIIERLLILDIKIMRAIFSPE